MPSNATSLIEKHNRQGRGERKAGLFGCSVFLLCCFPALLTGGCAPQTKTTAGREFPYLYYACNYVDARQVIRPEARDRISENVVLDNLRLGMASLAWGDLDEAERALVTAHEYLISGQVNRPDRTVAATIIDEGLRIWTGEPYEQAMGHYYLAALAMVKGDFENTRASIRNALFALRDFEDANDPTKFQVIESQFTLGYLLLGAANVLTGDIGPAERPLQRVRELRPDLADLVQTIADNDYDTLLLVDAGRGPRKVTAGTNDELIRFVPDGRNAPEPRITVSVEGEARFQGAGVVDLWRLSQNPRWWSLESARRAKSFIGQGLTLAGLGALIVGADAESEEAMYAGAGAMLAGLLLQGSARADTRHLAVLPRSVFVVPLTLGAGEHDVSLDIAGIARSDSTWHELKAGRPGAPKVYYLRVHDRNVLSMPDWPDEPLYEVDGGAGESYLLGGRNLSVPTEPRLIELARAEGLVFQPGPPTLSDADEVNPAFYRHITLGGRVWWTPRVGSYGYEYLTRTEHPAYPPRSDALRRIVQPTQITEPNAPEPGTIP